MRWDGRTRAIAIAGAGALVVAGLGLWGLAGAQAAVSHPDPASAGRLLDVRYEVRREPPYAPPPPSEATRLDVSPIAAVTLVDDAPAPEVDAAWRTLQVDDRSRMTAALAAIRAEDRRIDREMRASLIRVRQDDPRSRALDYDDDEDDGGR